MLRIDGEDHKTVSDAAKWFQVSVKTVREWIRTEVLPPPPRKEMGLREVDVFPDDYLIAGQQLIAERRKRRREQRKKRSVQTNRSL